jgi:hypothetical protein
MKKGTEFRSVPFCLDGFLASGSGLRLRPQTAFRTVFGP